jgi:acyl-coenzyme A thioesterase PaaI-like protein
MEEVIFSFQNKPPALQDIWAQGTCYGCGPANPHGLQIKSYWDEAYGGALCVFHPKPHHNAGFDNVMYGGLVASLCDCHAIWTAIAATYQAEGRAHGAPPSISYVTGNLNVSYLAPTPLDVPILLRAKVESLHPKKALVWCGVFADGQKMTAEAKVIAVRFQQDKAMGAAMP